MNSLHYDQTWRRTQYREVLFRTRVSGFIFSPWAQPPFGRYLGGGQAGERCGGREESYSSDKAEYARNACETCTHSVSQSIGSSNTVLARSWIVGRRTASLLCREVGSSARQASLCRRCRHQLILLRVLSSSFVQLVLRQIILLCCQHMSPLSPVLPSLSGTTRPQLALALALRASSSRRRKLFVLSGAACVSRRYPLRGYSIIPVC